METDVIIIGAGLAGLFCARQIAESGADVILVDRKSDLSAGIHTTGIFVRKTFEDFDFPPDTLGPPIREVALYSPSLRAVRMQSSRDEFRVGNMANLYNKLLDECIDAGVNFMPSTRYVTTEKLADASRVRLERDGGSIEVNAKVVVGADGANSRVAKDLGLDLNSEWIVGYEEVFPSTKSDNPRLHCFLDGELAPGYLAWVADDGHEVHVGVGGYAKGWEPKKALSEFKLKAKAVFDSNAVPTETRGGRIPVGGILKRIANDNGLLIGDAAGAVSPLTAGGLDPCMRLSQYASQVICERLEKDDPTLLQQYSGARFRTRFISRLWMRRCIAAFRSRWIIELGIIFMNTILGRHFAEHVFFGRGSFPDIQAKKELPKSASLNIKRA